MPVLRQSTAITDAIGPILDSAGAEYTGAVIGDLTITKNGTSAAMAAAATLTHIANGHYTLVFTTGNTDTCGLLTIHCNKSTYQMPRVTHNVVEEVVYDAIYAASAAGYQVPIWAAAGSTVNLSATTIATTQKVDLETIKTNPVVNAGTVTFPTTATLASTTNITAGTITTVTTVTNQLTAAAIATGIWQDATAGDFTTASSIGKSLYTSGVVPGASGGHFIAGTNAATTVTTAFTTTFTGNLTGSVGSVTGAVGSVTGAVGSVTGAVGSVTGNVGGNVTGNVGGNVTGSVGSVAALGITAGSFAVSAIDASAIAPDAIGSSELAATAVTEIVTAVLTTAMTEAYAADGAAPTVAQALFMLMSKMFEAAIVTTTETCKKLDGSTTAMTFTLNSATDPTSITRAS